VATLDILGGIPVINAIGTPRTIGETIGQRLKARLQVLAQYLKEQMASAIVNTDRASTAENLSSHLKKLVVPMARTEPSTWMEIESIARTTGIPEEDLLLIHGWGDLLSHYMCQVPPMRSTWISLTGSHTDTGMARAVFAWHLDPILFPYITLVRRMPAHGPASVSLTLAGLHPVAGMSEAGVAVGTNEMRISDGTEGHFTAHLLASALNAPTFDDALKRIQMGPRHGGGALHLLSAADERATVELSGQTTARLQDPLPTCPRVHTNHALDHEVMRWLSLTNDPLSQDRLAFVAARVVNARSADPHTVSTWFGMMKTIETYKEDSRQPPPDLLSPDTTVLLIMDPCKKTMHLKRGGIPARMESIQL
jgi:isopenicillin-N N-acyltransferase-like protein